MASQYSAKMILNANFLLSLVMASTLISFGEAARQLNEKPKVGVENINSAKVEDLSGTKTKGTVGDSKAESSSSLPAFPFPFPFPFLTPPLPQIPFLPPLPEIPPFSFPLPQIPGFPPGSVPLPSFLTPPPK